MTTSVSRRWTRWSTWTRHGRRCSAPQSLQHVADQPQTLPGRLGRKPATAGVAGHHRDLTTTAAGLQIVRGVHGIDRSEEHTSELQSLMRISYAVFCLKKK